MNYRLIKEENFTTNLCNNDILMYSTHNEGNSVIAEKFIKTVKAKIYLKMAANDSYLIFLIWIN